MDFPAALILGAVQGITEFLPVSSTGHLIIARDLFGFSTDYSLAVDAVLHLATAGAVLLYFRDDFFNLLKEIVFILRGEEGRKEVRILLLALILGTIPAVFFGLLLESYIETSFRSVLVVAYALIGGSILMLGAELLAKQRDRLTAGRGWWIGFFQALALIPGISRSGSTISGGLLLGLARKEAARFAFLLAFPIILGAGFQKAFELQAGGVFVESGVVILGGALSAFITGYLSIHYLLKYLTRHSLMPFIVYRLLLAAFLLFGI